MQFGGMSAFNGFEHDYNRLMAIIIVIVIRMRFYTQNTNGAQ